MSDKDKIIEDLAASVKKGDYRRFGELMRFCIYIPKSFAETAAKVGYDSDDLRQEASIALFHALHSYDANAGTGFRTYSSVCIRRRLCSVLRAGFRPKKLAMVDTVLIDDAEELFPSQSPEDVWIENESRNEKEEKIFSLLSEFENSVFSLYLNGLSYKESAERLSVSEKSVGNALQRVRKKLRSAT
jgi:RNA polymerase sporulation-specific sigma factor